jgi:hypothetical protein
MAHLVLTHHVGRLLHWQLKVDPKKWMRRVARDPREVASSSLRHLRRVRLNFGSPSPCELAERLFNSRKPRCGRGGVFSVEVTPMNIAASLPALVL